MNLDRLQEFELLLRNLPTKVPELTFFYMGSWYLNQCSILGTETVVPLKMVEDDYDCGTAACALGVAGLYKPFRDQGLKTNKTVGLVWYKTNEGTLAGRFFFDLTDEQACWLFLPQNYMKSFRPDRHNVRSHYAGENVRVTPETVARRVRRIINGTAPEFRR